MSGIKEIYCNCNSKIFIISFISVAFISVNNEAKFKKKKEKTFQYLISYL